MRTLSITALTAASALLAGCVTYPVYPPAPVVRLTPAQSAALPTRPLNADERARLERQNAEVQREDQAALEAERQAAVVPYAYTYGYPVAPIAPYGYGYYGYPGYGAGYSGLYPWVPGISLSLGYSAYRGWGGHRHWRGHGHGHRGGRWRR